MGLFRRSPSPAVPAQFEQQQQQHQQQTRHETANAHLGVEQRQYYSNPNSGTPSPNLSLENTRSRSPLPTNTNASSSNSNASPWTGYLKEGQHASADNTKKARSKTNKTELKKAQSPQQATEQFADVPSVMPTVELKKLNLGDSGSRASNLDLARFSINGMLNLVDQRVNMEERQQGRQHQKTTGLGLSVGSSSGQSSFGRGRHTPMVPSTSMSKRAMHTVGEEEETLSGPSPVSSSNPTQPRHRTSSSASDAASLRDEVVDLLALARKASSNAPLPSSSSSFSSSSKQFNIDMSRCTSSASARTGDSISPPHSAATVPTNTRTAVPGTASREQLEELARAMSPAISTAPGKTKKKFGLFGGGKKGDISSSKESPSSTSVVEMDTIMGMSAYFPSPLPHRAAPAVERSETPRQHATPTPVHHGPPVAGSHRNQLTAQHRRKRSMSVGDASAFCPPQSTISTNMNTQRPAVYDESYFSNLKTPYCSNSLDQSGGSNTKRSNQLARLGIVEDFDKERNNVKIEKENLANAKERLLAQARTAVGYPGYHQKRQGQLVSQGSTGDFHLKRKQTAQTTWTTPLQQQPPEARTSRSNSDASILNPFLPDGRSKNAKDTKKPAHLVVPPFTLAMGRSSPDSVSAIGPPPASPLPSPPRTSSNLPSATQNGRISPALSRAPSPKQRIVIPAVRSPAPTSPLPPLPAAICPAPTQRTWQASGALPPARNPPPPPTESSEKTGYDFDLRPHRTKQQGRTRLSPLTERAVSPVEAPSLDKIAVPPRPFGTRGIVQRPPSALDMTLLPSPSSSASPYGHPPTSAKSMASSVSSSSVPTPKARDFNQAQIRRRQETDTTLASQYSTEGDFENYDPSRSSASSGVSSSTTGNFTQGSSSHASRTTLSSATSYGSNSSMTSYNSTQSSCVSRPSLSMDGHSTEDESSVSSHSNHGSSGGFVHVNMAVPMKPPRRGMVASPSTESVNNLAGIGLAKGQYTHNNNIKRMNFGWSRHKAMNDLASHAEDLNETGHYDSIVVEQGNNSRPPLAEEVSSPGSEDDVYAGIIGGYAVEKRQDDDEGYIGSSPEMVSSSKGLPKSHVAPARQRVVNP